MLKGLALTPPVIGRISIGKVVEKNGKRLPEKDDEFTITSQVQNRDGWVNHPLDEQLRKDKNTKLRSIPVRLLFDDPHLSLRANYTMFDRPTGRPLCVGNGETCKRATLSGMQSFACPSPQSSPLAEGGNCKPYGRLNVRVDVHGPGSDELGSFVIVPANTIPPFTPLVPTITPVAIIPPSGGGSGGSSSGGASSLKSKIYSCAIVSEKPYDGASFRPGDSFDKSWTIKNTGSATWEAGWEFEYKGGEDMSPTGDFLIGQQVKPGGTITLVIEVDAPKITQKESGKVLVMIWSLNNGSHFCTPFVAIKVFTR